MKIFHKVIIAFFVIVKWGSKRGVARKKICGRWLRFPNSKWMDGYFNTSNRFKAILNIGYRRLDMRKKNIICMSCIYIYQMYTYIYVHILPSAVLRFCRVSKVTIRIRNKNHRKAQGGWSKHVENPWCIENVPTNLLNKWRNGAMAMGDRGPVMSKSCARCYSAMHLGRWTFESWVTAALFGCPVCKMGFQSTNQKKNGEAFVVAW